MKSKERLIARVARELVGGINKQETREKKDRIHDIDTLCFWGPLGLWTPRQVSEAFYNSIDENRKKESKRRKR